jgi:hypothetical protein
MLGVAGGFAALAVAVGVAFYALPGLHADPARSDASTAWEESAAGFRDRILLGTGWGRALADFYYRNTLLPAEAIRRPRRAQQRVALVLGDPGPLTVSSRLGRQWRFFPTRELGATWFYAEEAATPENLAARLRPPPEIVFWIVGTGTPERNPFYAPLKAERDAATRLVIVGGPTSLAAPGGPFAGARHVPLPVRPERMADAIGAVLDGQDRADGLRQLLGAANLSLVLGAGLLLAGLVLWSAWAWGALGAAAAIGPWTRRAAWIAGPAAALAGWGALALAAAAGGGGLCPPPTPLADPVKALTSADVCDRLGATQQIVREGTRNRALRTPEARSILLATLGDGDPRVRFWAAAALGATYHRRAVPLLVSRLRDPDLRVRYRAARSLGLLGDRIAIEPLREMMRTDTWYAANYARTALRRIGVLRGSAR